MKSAHRLTYRALVFLSMRLKRHTPAKRKQWAHRLAKFFYQVLPLRKKEALNNLQNTFSKHSPAYWDNVLKQCYHFFSHNFLQFLAFPNSYPAEAISVSGREHLDWALQEKRGVALVTGHFGAWEILAAWLGINRYPIVGIINRQKNRGADRFFREIRESNGVEIFYRKTGLSFMYQALKDNKILGLASDQDARRRGVFVPFLGRLASTPKGAARFHLQTGAPIIFATCSQTGNSYHLKFEPVVIPNPATVENITQSFTSLLEKEVRKYPEQYFWFHRRWKTRPEAQSKSTSEPTNT